MSKPRLIVIGPLPPPVHGVAVSTSLILANPILCERFDVEHLDTTDRRSISNLGKWDLKNIVLGLRALALLARRLLGTPGVVYLPLSENTGGFARDSLLINLAAARGWTTAVHIRNSMFQEFYAARRPLFQLWIRFTLRRVGALAVLGESLRQLFEGLIDPGRISVVPNGTPEFDRDSTQPNPHRVLYLSNLSRKKGADCAVRAALLVLERAPSTEFVFAGAWQDAEFERELRQLAGTANGRIAFLPPVSDDEKHDLVASAYLLLFPVSWGEGHPRIVLEALAAGLPVVTTDRATIAATVGDAGFVLPDPVPDEVADRILRLLHDVDLRERMSRVARERYLKHFTQDKADRTLAQWLERVASG